MLQVRESPELLEDEHDNKHDNEPERTIRGCKGEKLPSPGPQGNDEAKRDKPTTNNNETMAYVPFAPNRWIVRRQEEETAGSGSEEPHRGWSAIFSRRRLAPSRRKWLVQAVVAMMAADSRIWRGAMTSGTKQCRSAALVVTNHCGLYPELGPKLFLGSQAHVCAIHYSCRLAPKACSLGIHTPITHQQNSLDDNS